MGIFRSICIWIDHVAFGFIDDAYSIIFDFATINVDMSEFSKITKNLYIIVGIFALFRIALFLVNALIDPDKLTEKGKGLSNILVRTFIMLILLVITPFLFNELFVLQNTIMKENIIPKLIIGEEIYGSTEDNLTVNEKSIGTKAGDQMQSIIIEALVPVNRDLFDASYEQENADPNDIYYTAKKGISCTDSCVEAINNYAEAQANGNLTISTISKYIKVEASKGAEYEETGEKHLWVYDYSIIITTIAGGFLTYMLFSYALDIAVRMFELIVLQVLSPIFIVTFIDPKSASNGPFKKWISAIGKSYATLFLRIGMVCLMVLLISWVTTSDVFSNIFKGTSSALAKVALVLGLLIFIKNLPKWLAGMLGIEASGFGGLNIAKKLGGAALVGGALEKGIGSAKKSINNGAKAIGNQAKKFGANRVRNTAARVGGIKEQHQLNKANKKAKGDNYNRKTDEDRGSLWSAGRAAAKESRANNWGQAPQGFFKDIGAGYMGGRTTFNPDAKSINATLKAKAAGKAEDYNTSIGNTSQVRKDRADYAKKLRNAKETHSAIEYNPKTGERDKIKSWQGYNEFKAAIGDDAISVNEALRRDVKNNGGIINSDGTIVMKDGAKYTSIEDYKQRFTPAGLADIEAFTMKNLDGVTQTLNSNVQLRDNNNNQIINFQAQLSQLASQNNLQLGFENSQKINQAQAIISQLPSDSSTDTPEQSRTRQEQMSIINNLSNDKDFLAYQTKIKIDAQIGQLEAQNTAINNQNGTILEKLVNADKQYVDDPKKNPSAVKSTNAQGEEIYITTTGEYTKDSNGKWNYTANENADRTKASQFVIDPTKQSEIDAKISGTTASKEKDSKELHDAAKGSDKK